MEINVDERRKWWKEGKRVVTKSFRDEKRRVKPEKDMGQKKMELGKKETTFELLVLRLG